MASLRGQLRAVRFLGLIAAILVVLFLVVSWWTEFVRLRRQGISEVPVGGEVGDLAAVASGDLEVEVVSEAGVPPEGSNWPLGGAAGRAPQRLPVPLKSKHSRAPSVYLKSL